MMPKPPGGEANLSGILLVATPVMRDPNFQKAVVLISVHDRNQGAIGVIINRPLSQTLGDLDDTYADGPLGDVELFEGGPVHTDQMILTAWQWDKQTNLFKLYFGISYDKAVEMLESEQDIIFRGFLGYSGWRYHQLNEEIAQDAWILAPINEMALKGGDKEDLWRNFIASYRPELFFLAQAPNDPTLN